MENTASTTPSAGAAIDQATQDRLARLAARTTGSKTGPTGNLKAETVATSGRTTPPAGKRTRKRHAAKASRTAALVMSVATSFGLSAYFHFANSTAASAASNTAAASAGTVGSAGTTTGATTGTASAALANGTYVGSTDTNRWGPVQVQITVTGGKITDVTALQTPSDNSKDLRINSHATPILASEALTAQSANIHTVSGATYTSNSYKVSLQSAIDQARAAALKTGVVA